MHPSRRRTDISPFTDKPDGSGWLKKDAALSEELEAQLAANQSHLYFYWVNKAAD
eukprot:SAG22_NODE_17702_length_300_cov_0.761194_1_plen_54_part_10